MSSPYDIAVDPEAPNNSHAFVIGMVGSDQRVLEVGCSVGHVTEHLVARGNRVVGVEIDAEAAEGARRFAERVWVHDLDARPLSTVEHEQFDVIVLGDVLEHLKDPGAALRDLTTMLAPGGRLVISVPHVGFIDVRLMLLQGEWEYDDDGLLDRTHLRWFTRDSLRELLAGAGFSAVRVERVSFHTGFTSLPINVVSSGPDVIRFIEADPEAHTFQFVVEALRSEEAPVDALAVHHAPHWPDLTAERLHIDADLASLRAERDALQAEVEAWRNARIVKFTQPLRSLYGKARAMRHVGTGE